MIEEDAVRDRELHALGAPRVFAVRRRADGRWYQERTPVVGFHWQTSGVAWCRLVGNASKWPRSLAEQIARQYDGEVVEVLADEATSGKSNDGGMRCRT